MRINEHVALATDKILLVPYCKHHAPTYHEWMKDEELREATASEPLSLEAEYAMQESWRKDPDKLTFILCLPREKQGAQLSEADDAASRMIGDVNLFLTPDADQETTVDGYKALIGELEIMIARKDLHRKGFGTAALRAFMGYIFENLAGILAEYHAGTEGTASGERRKLPVMRTLRVKIGVDNERSIALFENLWFEQVSGPNVFNEVELRLEVDHDWQECAKRYPTPRTLDYQRETDDVRPAKVPKLAHSS